jgi:hypothetical protein
MAQDGREKRSLKDMWRERRARKRERMLAKAERLSHQRKIDERPEMYEQAVRSVPTSAGGQIPF